MFVEYDFMSDVMSHSIRECCSPSTYSMHRHPHSPTVEGAVSSAGRIWMSLSLVFESIERNISEQ